MKHLILSFLVLFCLSPALVFGASSGTIDCQGRTGITALERPNSMVAVRQLSCNQNVSVIGMEQGYVKIQITDHLIGFVEARYVRVIESTAATEPKVSTASNTAAKSATLADSRPQTSTDSNTVPKSGSTEDTQQQVTAASDATTKLNTSADKQPQISATSGTAAKPSTMVDSQPEISAEPGVIAKSDIPADFQPQAPTKSSTVAKSSTPKDSQSKASSPRPTPEKRPQTDQVTNRTSREKPVEYDHSRDRNYPRMELFGGYSLQKISKYPLDNMENSENGTEPDYVSEGSSFIKKGFSGSFTYNVTPFLGLEAAIRYHADNTSGMFNIMPDSINDFSFSYDFKREDTSFLVGPRFTFRNSSRIAPFAHALVGYSGNKFSLDGTLLDDNDSPITDRTEIITSKNFGVAVGGGLDLSLNDNWAIRLIQADYYISSHDVPIIKKDFDPMQLDGTLYTLEEKKSSKNIALSFGVVFRFGR